MSAVVVLPADFFKKDTEVFTVDGTKEMRAEALCFDSDSDSYSDEVKGLDDDDFDTILLISNDDEPRSFEVTKKAALLSKLVEAVLEGDASATEIPLRRVDGDDLALVVKYLEHHCGKQPPEIEMPIRSVQMQHIVDDLWDVEFSNARTMKELLRGMVAANYMDCRSLLQLFAAKFASVLKGKSPEEIRQILTEKSDMIPPRNPHKSRKKCQAKKSTHSKEDTKEAATDLPSDVSKPDTEEATDKMDDSTLMDDGDEAVSDKPEPSHSAAHTEEDTKEDATELQSDD